MLEVGAHEIDEQRDNYTPGDDAAGEIERSELRPDDVANADEGGLDGGIGEGGRSSYVDGTGTAELYLADTQGTEQDGEGFFGGEQLHDAEPVDDGSQAHIPEQEARGVGARLAGLVDLGSGHAFGEGQFGVFDHHAADERDEQDAQDGTDHHQHGGFPVGIFGAEGLPDAGDDKGGKGEDGAGRHALANRARGTGEVFFQNGAAPDAEDGHGDDGGRVSGSDGDSSREAEVGVGRAKDDRHHQTE